MDIHYKGYSAKIFYASGPEIFYGSIPISKDIIAFQAKQLKDAEIAMKEAVNQYIIHLARQSRSKPMVYS